MDNITVGKSLGLSQPEWEMGEVEILLKERNAAFRSGDGAQYCAARANLRRGIRSQGSIQEENGGSLQQQHHHKAVGPAHHQLQAQQPLSSRGGLRAIREAECLCLL